MADTEVHLRWVGTGLIFRGGKGEGPEIVMDGDGKAGPSPMTALLLALIGCTGADIVSIVEKMRVPLESFDIVVDADRAPEHPRRYLAIRVTFRVKGVAESDHDKVHRAVQLSHDRYCSVFHSLRTDIAYTSNVEFA